MLIPTTVTNPLSAPASQALGRGLPWRAGAVLQAVVLDASAPGRVELQIGNQTLSARSLFPLSEGQVLSLRVTQTGELVVLSTTQEEAQPGAPRTQDALLAQQALREALPRQAPLPPLLANLTLLAREPERFPPAIVEAARTALRAVADLRVIADPAALAERIARSGVWLEAALAGHENAPPPPALNGDWKAALLRLAATLRVLALPAALPEIQTRAQQPDDVAPLLQASKLQPQGRAAPSLEQLPFDADDVAAPARHLLKQVEGALARVEVGQLASLRAEPPGTTAWLLELPVRASDGEADVLQLRIERDAGGAQEEQAVWAVSLAFDLGELGPVRARIAVRGETVSTLFFAERAATATRVREQLDGLESALLERGLEIGSMGCRAGAPEPDPIAGAQRRDGPLLEVEA